MINTRSAGFTKLAPLAAVPRAPVPQRGRSGADLPYTLAMSTPFYSPLDYVDAVALPAERTDGLLFVFRSDQLLVTVGPAPEQGSDDPRVRARPSRASLPIGRVEGHAAPEAPFVARIADWQAPPQRALYLGTLGGAPCYAIEVAPELAAPDGLAFYGLRSLFSVLDEAHLSLAGRALQLVDWDRTHRYCGRCATPTETRDSERARRCPACGLVAYPRIAPAVMALVRRGRELLLGRGVNFPPQMWSALAGFVEPGETLEECVRREVREEAGVEVTGLRYFASQPWPFPHSLMIAFVCDYQAGELRPQPEEIEAVGWFDVDRLPQLPGPISIARRLIDFVAAELRGAPPE